MASNEVSDRTLRRLRLTLAKRIAEGCEPESSQYHKRRCGLPVQESDRSNCLDHHLSFNEREVEMTDTETESDCSDLDEGSINSDYRNDDSEGLYCLSECGCDPPTGFELAGDSEQENGSGASVEETVMEPEVTNHGPRVPLFEGSQAAEDEALVALLSLASRHRLTYACIEDILRFVSSLLPMPNGLTISLYRLLGRFVNFSKETIVHKFCGNCSAVLQDGSRCTRPACLSVRQQDATFIEIPLQYQIQERMQEQSFYDLVQYRFTRDSTPGELQDVYDGKLYTDEHEFFSCKNNLSLNLNYDGAPKFRSSGMQVWPIQFIINELPPQIRTMKEHILIGGVWCSCQKPPASVFLQPVMKSLQTLESQGVVVKIQGSKEFVCRVKLLTVIADLPAKASVLNCNQFNGRFGCSTCEHEGKQVKVGRGSTRVYPYQPNVKLRSSSENDQYAEEATKNRKVVCGVKGKSPLQVLPHFDIIKGVPVDYMHCVLLGLVRKLLSLWFDSQSSNSKNEWYIGKHVAQVDRRLVSIAPPESVERAPRSIEKHRQYWKAQECRHFLLYYVPATLSGILPDPYLAHTLMLVKGVRILLGTHITPNDLQTAHNLLDVYVKLYEEYYGQKHCVINLHLLTHLTFYVKLCGPLWTHSAFGFESFMGGLLQQTHSTHDIGNQMVTHLLLNKKLKPLRASICNNEQCPIFLRTYLASFDERTTSCLGDNVATLTGKQTSTTLNSIEVEAVNEYFVTHGKPLLTSTTVMSYSKVVINKQTIQSRSMTRAVRTNSFTVAYHSDGGEVAYGLVEKLISFAGTNLAIIKQLKVSKNPSLSDTLSTQVAISKLMEDFVFVEELNSYVVVEINRLLMKCFNTSIGDYCTQLTHSVNSIELIL